MARRSPRGGKPKGGQLWQTENILQTWQMVYRNEMVNILLTRFKWINLPQGCDERYLELTLLRNGVATICQPKKMSVKGSPVFFTTQAVLNGKLTIYENPAAWDSYGINGWRYRVTPKNGALVFDNHLRCSIMPHVNLLAQELADIKLTKQVNRTHVRNPIILKGPQTKRQDLTNLYSAWNTGSPAVIAVGDMDQIQTDVFLPKVDFLGKELQEDWINIWDEFYRLSGISNLPFKAERQIRDEVASQLDPTQLAALDPLGCRRTACKQLNDRFGLNIEVVWNEDYQSDNFAALHNVQTASELGIVGDGENDGRDFNYR